MKLNSLTEIGFAVESFHTSSALCWHVSFHMLLHFVWLKLLPAKLAWHFFSMNIFEMLLNIRNELLALRTFSFVVREFMSFEKL